MAMSDLWASLRTRWQCWNRFRLTAYSKSSIAPLMRWRVSVCPTSRSLRTRAQQPALRTELLRMQRRRTGVAMEGHESDRVRKPMRQLPFSLGRQLVATCLVVLLAASTGEAATAQQAPPAQQQPAPSAQQPQSAPLDDSKTADPNASDGRASPQATPAP